MAILLIVLLVIVGLAWKAGLYGTRASVADGETEHDEDVDVGFFDLCARSFVVVLLCLIGLLALGVIYGNVLGAANAAAH